MSEDDDTAFMADLLLGARQSKCALLPAPPSGDAAQEQWAILERIVDRLRAQTIHIIAAYRHWQLAYQRADAALERRFLRYEGMLVRQDLLQHWMLYRRAVAELHGGQQRRRRRVRAA